MSEHDDPEQNKSVGWVAIGLAIAVLYFGWTFLAADYNPISGPHMTRRSVGAVGVLFRLIANSIGQLGNFSAVMDHAFHNRMWFVILVGVLEVGVFLLWMFMKKLERELYGPQTRRRKKAGGARRR